MITIRHARFHEKRKTVERSIKELQQKLSNVFWLGGSTCAGKTTISNRLSSETGFSIYHCDQFIGEHINKASPLQHPAMYEAAKVSWDKLLSYSTAEFLKFTIQVYQEEFKMIIEDLLLLPKDKPVLVEGVNIFPDFVCDVVSDKHHAIWIIATEEHYRANQPNRKEMYERLKTCSDPVSAQNSYMIKDIEMGKYILNRCKALNQKTIMVEEGSSIEENINIIKKHFPL